MALKHPRNICKRCQQGPKSIKARGLCDSCYMAVKASGHLEDWPRIDEMSRRHLHQQSGPYPGGYCQCFSPIPQHIGPFNAVQCLKCGKKLPDDS